MLIFFYCTKCLALLATVAKVDKNSKIPNHISTGDY